MEFCRDGSYYGPLPGANCNFTFRGRSINGKVISVEITKKGTYITVKAHKPFRVTYANLKIRATRCSGWMVVNR